METLTEMIEKVEIDDIFKPMRVLFVCTGNTCRSPMAAAAANSLCHGHVHAESAGLSAFEGMPISRNAQTALENAGIKATPDNDYPNHTSRLVTADMIKKFNRVYGISSAHTARLISMFPEYASKFDRMPNDIADPFGSDVDDYERCLDKIILGIKEIFHLE